MKYRHKSVIPFLISLLGVILIYLSACGGSSDTPYKAFSRTGSIAFSVVWKGGPAESVAFHPTQIDCDAIGVATIEAEVYDVSFNIAGSGGPWNCENHSGTISGIRPGTGYKVMIFALDGGGDVIYQGEITGITVTAGQTTNAGEIVLELVGPGDGGGVSLADLAGTWYGVREDPVGSLATISVILDGSGNITRILLDGIDYGLIATVTKVSDQIFSYTDSEGTQGVFFVDAAPNHASFVDEYFNFVVVEKGASSLPTYTSTDIIGTWSGYGFVLDINIDIAETWISSATVASNSSFSGTNSLDVNFDGSFSVYDSTYGAYYGEFSNNFGKYGEIGAFLSADKSFAASWAMAGSFPEDVSFECWNKH